MAPAFLTSTPFLSFFLPFFLLPSLPSSRPPSLSLSYFLFMLELLDC